MPATPPTAEVTIQSLGGLGDGIGTLGGKPVFVPKSCAGDVLRISIIHENHQGMQGSILEVLSPGADRATPPCPHFSACGGCTLQQLTPDAYRTFKTRILHSALAQAGFPMPRAEVTFLPAASRRRVEFKITPDKTLGLLPLRSHLPIPIAQCLVLEPALQALIEPLNALLPRLPGEPTALSITLADNGVDMLLSYRAPFSGTLPEEFMALASRVSVRVGDAPVRLLAQSAPVEMLLGGYAIPLQAGAFLQATKEGQRLLMQAVLEGVADAARVADLFCGIGTYSFPLSRTAQVHAAELDAGMTGALAASAKAHGIGSLTSQQRDLFKKPLAASELDRFDAVVINPPRLGAKAQCEQLAQSRVRKIVMVSCNPATFARDAKMLKNGAFTLMHASGVDQFVWNQHLELTATFCR